MTKVKVSLSRARDFIVARSAEAERPRSAVPNLDCRQIPKDRAPINTQRCQYGPIYTRLHTREKTITQYPIGVIDLYYPLSIAVVLYNFSCYTLGIAPK